jgi:hypothetical protein
MTKASPITRDHVLDAMTYVGSDPDQWPVWSRPRIYVVVDPRNGASLPPKLVLVTAAQMASSDRRYPIISGGEYTNKRLRELGFLVLEKAAAEPISSPGL